MWPFRIGVSYKKRGNIVLQERLTGQPVHDTTPLEVEHHQECLLNAGYDVCVIPWGRNYVRLLEESGVHLIFNLSSMVETAIADEQAVPYVGSDPLAVAVTTDKQLAKLKMRDAGISTSPSYVAKSVEDCQIFMETPPFNYPLFVKPCVGRGSAGITEDSVVENYESLEQQVRKITDTVGPALIERYLRGMEISLGVIGNGNNARVLSPLEITYKGGRRTLTFNAKETDEDIFTCPADLSSQQTAMMKRLALEVYRTLGLRDYGRIDTILTEEGPYVLEANCFAGLSTWPVENPMSYMGRMAVAEGIDGAGLLDEIVKAARSRIGI